MDEDANSLDDDPMWWAPHRRHMTWHALCAQKSFKQDIYKTKIKRSKRLTGKCSLGGCLLGARVGMAICSPVRVKKMNP
jgi:hypothetical protein